MTGTLHEDLCTFMIISRADICRMRKFQRNIVRGIKTHFMFSNVLSKRRWAGHVARLGDERGCIGSWWGNRKEGNHWGDLGVDGWIILGRISRRWDVGIWTGLGWPRIETGGGRL